jgi:hypothetical protein
LKKDEEIIKRIKNSLSQLAFADVKKASDGGAKMGAFILASCFIDYLAGFYYGHKAKRDQPWSKNVVLRWDATYPSNPGGTCNGSIRPDKSGVICGRTKRDYLN